ANDALKRTLVYLPLVAAWTWVHPALGGGHVLADRAAQSPVLLVSIIRSMANVDWLDLPPEGWRRALLVAWPAAVALSTAALAALRWGSRPDAVGRSDTWRASGLLCWAALAWVPLLA